jgi:hypothetical protein
LLISIVNSRIYNIIFLLVNYKFMSKDRILPGQGVAEMRLLRTSEIPQPSISFRIPTAQEEWERCTYYYDKRGSFDKADIFHYLRLPTTIIMNKRGAQIGGDSTLGGYKEPNRAFSNFYRFADPLSVTLGTDQITPADFAEVGQFFMDRVYPDDGDKYKRYLKVLETNRPIIEDQVFPRFQKMQQQWGFVIPSKGYDAVLTLYGTEGSYNSNTNPGKVIVPPFKERPPWVGFQLRGYSDKFSMTQLLTNTVHEMLHIGVQEPVIDQFGLNQAEKELVIDWMCQNEFGDLLPDYTPQTNYTSPHNYDPNWARVRKLHRHLLENGRINNLPQTISTFVQSNPR